MGAFKLRGWDTLASTFFRAMAISWAVLLVVYQSVHAIPLEHSAFHEMTSDFKRRSKENKGMREIGRKLHEQLSAMAKNTPWYQSSYAWTDVAESKEQELTNETQIHWFRWWTHYNAPINTKEKGETITANECPTVRCSILYIMDHASDIAWFCR